MHEPYSHEEEKEKVNARLSTTNRSAPYKLEEKNNKLTHIKAVQPYWTPYKLRESSLPGVLERMDWKNHTMQAVY